MLSDLAKVTQLLSKRKRIQLHRQFDSIVYTVSHCPMWPVLALNAFVEESQVSVYVRQCVKLLVDEVIQGFGKREIAFH